MPNIWTHILFCDDIVDTINSPKVFSKYSAYMKLGAQGPDPFFYYNFWPWIKEEPVHDIGMILHTKRCGDFVMDLIDSAKYANLKVRAYVFGFVTHHILDRNTHPYIHYRAGYEGSDHQRLEIIIDTLMMERYASLQSWKIPVYREINVGSTLDPHIVNLLDTIIKRNHPEINQKSAAYIQKSYQDMKLALRILSDPHGWKNILLQTLISAYSHRPIKNDMDYLNLNETVWYHSATNEPSTKSFIQLYDVALVEGIEIMATVLDYWDTNGDQTRQRLSKLIGNISFDTGTPLALNLKNKYSESFV